MSKRSKFVETEVKKTFIELLLAAGLKHIEVGSFVSPIWVPQMQVNINYNERLLHSFPLHILHQNSAELFTALKSSVLASQFEHFSALTPNMKGLKRSDSSSVIVVIVVV